MIPKIIHYCWFGGAEIPSEYAGYISEWQQLHPGWEIKQWDEQNFSFHHPYLKKAFELQNWANLANFARLQVLQEFGGIYLDTDIKLLKPLDPFLENTCFLSFESGAEPDSEFFVNNAVLGSVPNGTFVQKCLEALEQTFDGTEEAHLSSPRLTTKVLKEVYNLDHYGDQVLNDVRLYGQEIFYPLPYNKVYDRKNYLNYCAPETVGVHIWGRTWFSKELMLATIDYLQALVNEQKEYIAALEKNLPENKLN